MAKKSFKLEDVEFALTKNQIEAEKRNALLADLQAMLEEEAADKEPKNPKQFVVLVSDPEGKITGDYVAWVLQIPEEESVTTINEKISLAAVQYNNGSRAGKKLPVQSIGEAIEAVTAKFFKENEVWVKTKEPVLVIKTDNKLIELGE